MHDEELASVLEEVRVRVRARYPEGPSKNSPFRLPSLLPLLHARDFAEGKVSAIGVVNPRPPGFKNAVIQWMKRRIARVLDWHVREQVEFNRRIIECVQATLDALNETNAALAVLTAEEERHEALLVQSISELRASFLHRVESVERDFRALTERQHAEFSSELSCHSTKTLTELERLLHAELRVLRQHITAAQPQASGTADRLTARDGLVVPFTRSNTKAASRAHVMDWLRFAEQFRGPEEKVREHQKQYIERFLRNSATHPVLDLGCGRGEFLEVARETGLRARGIDESSECVALCRSKGLNVQQADLLEYLAALPPSSLGSAFCSHVIEHLKPDVLASLIYLLGEKMPPGALLVIETPNPEHPDTLTKHFYADPTHVQPVPASLLRFYLEEAGFGNIVVEHGPDYALFANKL